MGDPSNLVLSWRSVMMLMVCLPMLICAMLLFFKQFERNASVSLACFILLCVFCVGPQIIGFSGFYDVWPDLTFFPFNTVLWIGPLFYLHAYQLMIGGKLGIRKFVLVPGVVQTSYYCWAFFGLGDYQQKWDYSKSFHSPYIDPIEGVLAALFIVLAIVNVWSMSRDYKRYLHQTQSAVLEFEPVWVDRMIIAMCLGGAIFIGLELVPIFTTLSYVNAFPFQVLLMMTLAWLSIEAVWRLNQVFPKIRPLETHQIPDINGQKERNWQKEGFEIEQAILTNTWFLEPRFSLRELTKRMGSNEAYVSKAINQGLNKSFNEFINSLRVQHAQRLIKTTHKPLLNVALDSGFNSKATFNRVFRDLCQTTPSQYKKSIQ